MHRSKIEWVLNPDNKTLGWVWNPLTGCLNHVNGMCKGGNFPCYAYRLAHGRLKNVYLAQSPFENRSPDETTSPIYKGISSLDPFYLRFRPEKLKELACFSAINEPNYLKRLPRKERGIFVCDMSDLFGIGVPESWTRDILITIEQAEMHRFYLLTKQPQNLIKFSPFPDNCWVGVTATNQEMFYEGCYKLKYVKAKVKYLSFEPLLAFDKLPGVLDVQHWLKDWFYEAGISWLIIGAQTKPYKPPKIEWVREIVEAADKAGIPVFLKENLNPLFAEATTIKDKWVFSKTNFMNGEFYRQEMPNKQEEKG